MTTKLYDYSHLLTAKASAILNIGTVYEQLVSYTSPNLPAGEYVIAYSWEGNFNGQKNRPFFSQLTGTYAGEEFSDSIGDNDTGIKTRFYSFPKTWAGGIITLGIQCKKDALFSAQMDINFVDVAIRRVG